MRRHREPKRRRRYITIIAALVVIVLIGVGGFFGVRALKHWKAVNEANSQSQIEDYTGPGDKGVTFVVESGQGAAEIADNLVKAKIVKSAAAFTSAVSGAGATLYPGSYALRTHMRASDVVKCFLTKARPAVLPKCVRVNVCRTSSKMRRVCPAWMFHSSKP